MKWFSTILIAILLTGIVIPVVSAWDEVFPWAGTYYLDNIPANVSYLFINMAGAGGSGKSTLYEGGGVHRNHWGYGGSAAEFGNFTMVPVVYTTNYTVIVGIKGAQSEIDAASHAGTASSIPALGLTKAGGDGGIQGGTTAHAGGDGESTDFFSYDAGSGIPGGSVDGYAGGAGGIGAGAGGGGAAVNGSVDGLDTGIGGAGVDGYIHVWDMNGSAMNVPYYTASPTNTGYGSVVTFTDESILNDAGNLTYNWSFGDGQTSTTLGTVTHVYSSYGVFTTNLTLTSDTGIVYLSKPDYITITNVPITAWVPAKLVRLKIVDAYGVRLINANISVSYITNSLPSKDPAYLTSAFGISQVVANQMVTGAVAMQGYTGTDGSASFMMFPAIQYGITITNETIGLSKYVTIYPQDVDYVIYCPLTSQAPQTLAATYLYNSSLYVTEPNASWITWNLLYSDPSGHTTGLSWNVTCWNNMTVMHSNSWGAVGPTDIIVDNYTFPSEPKGMEYVALYDAVRDQP